MLVQTPSCVLWLMLGLVGWRFACTTDNNVFHVSSSQTTSLNKTIKIEWIVQIHSHFVNTTHSLARRGISLWTNENRTRMRQAAGQSHKRTGAQTGAIPLFHQIQKKNGRFISTRWCDNSHDTPRSRTENHPQGIDTIRQIFLSHSLHQVTREVIQSCVMITARAYSSHPNLDSDETSTKRQQRKISRF